MKRGVFVGLRLSAIIWFAVSARAAEVPAAATWAFQPVVRPAVPPAPASARNPIDAFILAKLAEQRLTLSPEADRRTLLRRLSFDLTGLPPRPEEVTAFEQDRRRDAYERVVERLLASPRYGERWARHWLDVVRFAETHGFEMNQPRPNAWPYRDYVIRAFNEDKPYAQFIQEQLAGDALGADEATGFLVGGAWDQVKSPEAALTATQRADELHDLVSTTASTFLGLTVGCARCHNHKFDPIPQTDYYAIKACLAGVQHGEHPLAKMTTPAAAGEAPSHRQRLNEIEAQLAAFEPLARNGAKVETNRLRAPVNARLNREHFAPVTARRLRFTITRTTDAEPCLDELEVYATEPAPGNVALASAGTTASASGVYPGSALHRLEHLNDGQHGNSRSWISNERGRGWVELEFARPVTIDRVLWGRDREQKFSDRLAVDYRIEVAMDSNAWQVVASSQDRRPYAADGKPGPDSDSPDRTPAAVKQRGELLAERSAHESKLKELLSVPMIYGGAFDATPGPTHRLQRGDPMQPREVIEPGGLSALPVKLTPATVPDTARPLTVDQQRRLALAQWITSPANPLPARVLVNRLWQYHFGEGLVTTPSDFGALAPPPSHPELLEWLAAEFAARGGSLKAMHRLIVNSATYRQSGAPRADALDRDAGARWLWRFPPRRLEAEAIRDTILAVSGQLDLTMGGPGWSAFEPNDNYVRVYNPRSEFGPAEWRRMIYQTKVRMQQDGTFGAFDCPDGAQIAPRRTRSTTPLQALNLLNSGFIRQQAEFFATRLEREAGRDPRTQMRRAFALAYHRRPDAVELAAAVRVVQEHGLAMACRALFNANEFIYLE